MITFKQYSTMAFAAKAILLLSLLNTFSASMAGSQYSLGIEPQFSQEDWYDKNEWNTNILPFVYETGLGAHSSIRLRSHLFLHTGGVDGTAISLLGLGAAWLWYLDPKSNNGQYHGFNFGPVAILSYDFLDEINHSTYALEAGHAFALSKTWSMNVAMQSGRSFFSGGKHPAAEHFGIYIGLSRWY